MTNQTLAQIWLLTAIAALTTASVYDYPKIEQPGLVGPLVVLITLYIDHTK